MSIDFMKLYNLLFERYGDLEWWPAETPYEVIVGAVLTQNTNWNNVEKAIANFKGNLTPERTLEMSAEGLSDIIRPAGFFNQKAVYLKAVTQWYKQYNYSTDEVRKRDSAKIRPELLSVRGVGRETADSILLYAFGFTEFVIDAYTMRLLTRLGLSKMDYEAAKNLFRSAIPQDTELYKNYHAAIVINAKTHCKKVPNCPGCPLDSYFD